MVTYEQWNKAIISYFFEDREPEEKVFLHISDETLPDIAEHAGFDVENAEESLKEAVRKKVVPCNMVRLPEIKPEDLSDVTSRQQLPQVAFLALCVLAASNMGKSEEVFHTNYYKPLNMLLFDKLNQGKPIGLKYKRWEEHWLYLRDWVEDNHDVALYLTKGPPNRKYVWYPISQCLISNRDRRNIYLFFRHFNLTPFSKVQDEKLESDLRDWLSSSSGSAKIERYFSRETYKESILNQVKSLLKHWDGVIPPEPPARGPILRTSTIRVQLHYNKPNNTEIRYWFLRRERNEIGLEDNLLGVKSLKTLNSEKWFRPQIDKKNAFWNLSNDIQLQTDEIKPIVYTLNHSDIWVFRKDKECDDGWISQRNMHLNEENRILFHKRLLNPVLTCLRQTCEHELEKPISINKNDIRKDWYYIPATPTTLKGFDDPNLWKLSVDPSNKISFKDGLSVDKNGHRAYLDICLPDVTLPDLGNSNDLSLQIGEQTFSVGKDRLVRLENKLGVGIHQLSYGKKTRELRIITPELPLKQPEKTLAAAISNQETIPIYSEEKIQEISNKSGVWLTGARFYGTDIPDCKLPTVPSSNQLIKSSAHLISSVIKLAIELKNGNTSIPEWFDEAIISIENNITLQTLVQKKLLQYKGKALSYEDLCKRGGE